MNTLLLNTKAYSLPARDSDHIIAKIINDLLPDVPMSFDWKTLIYHYLDHFTQAYKLNRPLIFKRYHTWARIVEKSRFQSHHALTQIDRSFLNYIHSEIKPSKALDMEQFFKRSLNAPDSKLENINDSWLKGDPVFGPLNSIYFNSILYGDKERAFEIIQQALEEGITVKDLYMNVFKPALYEVGRLWQLNRISVAQEHYFTAATEIIISRLYSRIFKSERNGNKLVTTAVGENLHELGIRMVSDLFEMEGWDTYYIGASCPAEEIIREIINQKADLFAISVTLVSQLEKASVLIQKIKKHDQCQNIPVLVGGRAFEDCEDVWRDIGADGYSSDINDAIEMATAMVEVRHGITKE